jgi:hypothetical protein
MLRRASFTETVVLRRASSSGSRRRRRCDGGKGDVLFGEERVGTAKTRKNTGCFLQIIWFGWAWLRDPPTWGKTTCADA